MGRLISSATLLAYVLVYLDGAAHIFSYSVGICPSVLGWGASYLQLLCWQQFSVPLDGAAHIFSYSVSICPSVLGWGGSYLLLLC
ncbi:hypothetical protein DPMN_009392 [Dreissena polymorpha]|uniref:Uncharacterized protein n=1 Tax=Dreissena polymorpha TaxID=45954 RepID=A0A9D4N140_DREPO|nr:hypothetical protein DPMN_009392 [Dreissena polymorpha]